MAKQRDDLRIELRDELKTDPNGKIWRDRELDRFLQIYVAIFAQRNMGCCSPSSCIQPMSYVNIL